MPEFRDRTQFETVVKESLLKKLQLSRVLKEVRA